jgi:hypothetical protein
MYELTKVQTDLNALVFVDCYALSNTMPSVDDWVLLLEAYEAIKPGDEQSAVVPGGPHKWEVTFKNLRSTDALKVALPFVIDSEPEHESCEIYKLKSEQISDGHTKIEIESDYINGNFVCESVQVKQLSA